MSIHKKLKDRPALRLRVLTVAAAAISLTLVVSTAYAANYNSADHTIDHLDLEPSGLRIYVSEAVTNTTPCTSSDYYWFPLPTSGSTVHFERAHAMLVASMLAGRPISFWITGCSGGGSSGRPLVYSVRMED